MLTIPADLQVKFDEHLRNRKIPLNVYGAYKKWLRYYLDYCHKYQTHPEQKKSLPLFTDKLREKQQTADQIMQAVAAVKMYYALQKGSDCAFGKAMPQVAGPVSKRPLKKVEPANNGLAQPRGAVDRKFSDSDAARVANITACDHHVQYGSSAAVSLPPQAATAVGRHATFQTGVSWVNEYARLENEIRTRHYSPKTLKTYQGWVKQLQAFTRSKSAHLLSTDDVKAFLTFLAVKRKVSATTQNQAFNALLFFYRHVLGREFGKVDGVVRAKRKPYIPVVLSREEIDAVLQHLSPPYDLVVKMLYGCGLRLFECLNLRVHCMNFDAGIVTVHDGKGKKDRSVPLPLTILPELKGHLEALKALHQRDLDRGYDGVFLINALEKKYKNAAREFVWQWLFPAIQLTRDRETGTLRRYHLHETHVQKAIKRAVNDARICKRASAHTFRHSFASHLLQGNYDIRTIQELLGHSEIIGSIIYLLADIR